MKEKKIRNNKLILVLLLTSLLIIPVTAGDNTINLWMTLPDGSRVIGEIIPTVPRVNEEIIFNTYIYPYTDSLSIEWYFGDGVFESGRNTTHSYPVPGTYSVSLIVTTNSGEEYTRTYDNYVVENYTYIEIIETPTLSPPSPRENQSLLQYLLSILGDVISNSDKDEVTICEYQLVSVTILNESTHEPVQGVWVNLTPILLSNYNKTGAISNHEGKVSIWGYMNSPGAFIIQDDNRDIDTFFSFDPYENTYVVMV